MPATAEPEVGVRYSARRNADGSWNLYDVPIMAPVPKGVRKAPEDIGEEWLKAAVEKAREREIDNGYLSPLHLYHPDEDTRPVPCGFFRPTTVRQVRYEGAEVPVVFATLVKIPDAFMERISRGEFPYRSPEVYDWKKGEISALALLDSELPYFKLSTMTGVRVESDQPEPLLPFRPLDATAPMPMAAFRASAHGGALLFRFDRDARALFADEAVEEKPDEKPKAGEDGGAGGEPGPAAEDANDGDAPTDQAPDDDPKVKAADEMVAGVMGKLDGIASALAKLCAVLCPTEEVVPPAKPKSSAEPEDLNDSGDLSKMHDAPEEIHAMSDTKPAPVDPALFAEMRAETAALRDKLNARDAKDAVATRLAAARAELKDCNIGPEVEAELAFFAEQGQDGLNRFVQTIKRISPKDPPKDLETLEGAAAKPTDPPEIAKFAADLPEEKRGAYFKAAREAGAEFDAIGKTPGGKRALRGFTRATYIQNHPTVQEFAA